MAFAPFPLKMATLLLFLMSSLQIYWPSFQWPQKICLKFHNLRLNNNKWNLISLPQYVFNPILLHVPAAPADLTGRGRELGSRASSSPGSDLQYGNKGKGPRQLLT